MEKYQAPKLTKYGKIQDIIQAGSIATGDLTGDGMDDTAVDNNANGRADVVVGRAGAGNTTPVTFLFNSTSVKAPIVQADFYDSDGDGLADFAIADLNGMTPTLQTIDYSGVDYVRLSDSGKFYAFGDVGINNPVGGTTETSSDGGWNDPSRD